LDIAAFARRLLICELLDNSRFK